MIKSITVGLAGFLIVSLFLISPYAQAGTGGDPQDESGIPERNDTNLPDPEPSGPCDFNCIEESQSSQEYQMCLKLELMCLIKLQQQGLLHFYQNRLVEAGDHSSNFLSNVLKTKSDSDSRSDNRGDTKP